MTKGLMTLQVIYTTYYILLHIIFEGQRQDCKRWSWVQKRDLSSENLAAGLASVEGQSLQPHRQAQVKPGWGRAVSTCVGLRNEVSKWLSMKLSGSRRSLQCWAEAIVLLAQLCCSALLPAGQGIPQTSQEPPILQPGVPDPQPWRHQLLHSQRLRFGWLWVLIRWAVAHQGPPVVMSLV